MKIGCSAYIPEIPLIHAMGYNFVELRGRDVAALSEREMDALEAQIRDLSLPCLSLNAYCPPSVKIAGPGFDLKRGRAYADALADRAGRIGVRKIGIGSPVSRNLPDGFDRCLAWEQTVAFTAETAEAFDRYGIKTGFEPLGYCYCNFINHIEEAMRLSDQLKPYGVGLILDFYNMEQCHEDTMPLDACAPYILHVHISDDMGGDPQKRAFLRMDKLEIHQERIHRLLATGYDGTLGLEVDIPTNCAAAENLAFIRKVVSEFQ